MVMLMGLAAVLIALNAPALRTGMETPDCYLGVPERIHTDQGAQFESRLMAELCTLWGVRKVTPPLTTLRPTGWWRGVTVT